MTSYRACINYDGNLRTIRLTIHFDENTYYFEVQPSIQISQLKKQMNDVIKHSNIQLNYENNEKTSVLNDQKRLWDYGIIENVTLNAQVI